VNITVGDTIFMVWWVIILVPQSWMVVWSFNMVHLY